MLCRLLFRFKPVRNLQHARTYCQQHEQQTGNASDSPTEEEIRSNILQGALTFVPQHGWSNTSIQMAVEQEGYPGIAHGMFPRGAIELVEHFYESSNAELAEGMNAECQRVESGEQQKRKTNAFIYDNVQKRISMIVPYRDNWHQAMALMVLPENAPNAWGNLHQLCDDIWFYAGDKSTDMNYYTKRLTIAALYKSTELYFLQDNSPDFQDSWKFLHRRMEDLTSAGKCIKDAQQGSDKLGSISYSAFLTMQNILGMNSRNR